MTRAEYGCPLHRLVADDEVYPDCPVEGFIETFSRRLSTPVCNATVSKVHSFAKARECSSSPKIFSILIPVLISKGFFEY